MRSSEGRLWFAVLAAVAQGGFLVVGGLLALEAPTLDPAARPVVTLMIGVGALWAVVAGWGTWRVRVRGPRPDARGVTLEPGRTRIARDRSARLLALATASMLVVVLAAFAVTLLLTGSGPALPVVLGVLAAAMLAFVPDLALRAARDCDVAFDRDGVQARSDDADVAVAWSDVTGVAVLHRAGNPVLRIDVHPGARSLRVEPRRRVLWRPRTTAVEVPFAEVHLPPAGLVRVVATWHAYAGSRGDLGTPASVQEALRVPPGAVV